LIKRVAGPPTSRFTTRPQGGEKGEKVEKGK